MDAKRRDKALQMAATSEHPAVQQALEHLLVMMELAHSEEITEALQMASIKNRHRSGAVQAVARRDWPEWVWKWAAD